MPLEISNGVRRKLASKEPPVTEAEIVECFANRLSKYLYDVREDNKTNPPTRWFVAETDYGRKLKVVFMSIGDNIVIKTAFEPNPDEIRIYNKFSQPT